MSNQNTNTANANANVVKTTATADMLFCDSKACRVAFDRIFALEKVDDGEIKRRYHGLTATAITDGDVYKAYCNEYRLALGKLVECLNLASDATTEATIRNKAMEHVNRAISIVAHLADLDYSKVKLTKKAFRQFIVIQSLFNSRTDSAKSYTALKRLIEIAMYRAIVDGVPMEKTISNVKANEVKEIKGTKLSFATVDDTITVTATASAETATASKASKASKRKATASKASKRKATATATDGIIERVIPVDGFDDVDIATLPKI